MFANFLIIKNKEYLTEENSSSFILASNVDERLYKHCKCPNEQPFPCLRGALIILSYEEGRSFKGDVHLGWGALSDNYGIYNLKHLLVAAAKTVLWSE